MKYLFLFRDSYDARYILSKLNGKCIKSRVVLETGKTAKKKKLRYFFKNIYFWQYPVRALDLVFLLLYSSFFSFRMKKYMGKYSYPTESIGLTVDDANDEKCIDYIKRYKPQAIFIYGTSILKKHFLENINCFILNIHTGIVPYYRNVHSDFWAYLQDDKQHIGVTIMYVDAGIDTGDVLLKKSLKYEDTKSLMTIKIKNLELITEIIPEVIRKIEDKDIKREKQSHNHIGRYNTPGMKDIVRLILK